LGADATDRYRRRAASCHRGNRFADTAGLKQSLSGYRRSAQSNDAKSLRPFDVAIMDDSDADARHAVGRHAILKRLASVRVLLLHYGRGEARANTLNATLNFGRKHRLRFHPPWLKEQRGETRHCGQQV
jgi:hypothetical protein